MASQFHNRLIGTVILVSIGVIFLPDLLTGKHHKPQVPVDSMPLNPQEVAAKSPVSAAQPATNGVSGANVAPAQDAQVAQAGVQVSGSGASGVIVAGNPATTQPAATAATAPAPATVQQGSGQWTSEEVATPVTVKAPAHLNSAAALAAATGAAAVAKVHPPKPQAVKPVTPAAEKPATVRGYDSAVAVVANSAGTTGTVTASTVTTSTTQTAAQPATQPRKPARVQSGQIRSFADVIADDHGATAAAKTATPAAQAKSAVQATPAPTAAVKPATPVVPASKPAPVTTAAAPATGGGAAWVIQAGVFSNADNAKSLVAKLRAGGMPASLVPIHGGLYRVTVGPDVSRSNMESMVPRVSSIAGTSAKLISYATH